MPDGRLLIGAFARLSGVTTKALRHYDELGLLRPARVDPSTGYRRYGPEQAGRARAIRVMRELHMPLAEIAEALDDPRRTASMPCSWAIAGVSPRGTPSLRSSSRDSNPSSTERRR